MKDTLLSTLGMSVRACRACEFLQVKTIGDLSEYDLLALRWIPDCGKKTRDELITVVELAGLSLAILPVTVERQTALMLACREASRKKRENMPVSDDRFNFVMSKMRQYSNQVFDDLEFLCRCFPFVPDELKDAIEARIKTYCDDAPGMSVYYERKGDTITIRRIQ